MTPDSFWGGVLARLVAHTICLVSLIISVLIVVWIKDRRE